MENTKKRSFRDVLMKDLRPFQDIPNYDSHASGCTSNNSSSFRDAVNDDYHCKRLGENGCVEYTDSGLGSDILAISQMVRGADPSALTKSILQRGSVNEIVKLAELIFVTRNTRGGKGEKKLAYDMFLEFAMGYPETAQQLLQFFPHYGYWKDLLLLMEVIGRRTPTTVNAKLITASLDLIRKQWLLDVAALETYKKHLEDAKTDPSMIQTLHKKGPRISLLSKWLPRERSSLDKRIRFVEQYIKLVYPTNGSSTGRQEEESYWKSSAKAKYRKQVAELTSFLKLPEVLLAAQREDEIQFERVASKATKLLTSIFLNEKENGQPRSDNPKRIKLRDLFLDHIDNKGLKGDQVMPHEIVATILNNQYISKGMELSLDAQWKSIWKTVVEQVHAKAKEEGIEFNPTQMVPICDVSGSMCGTPIQVAIALSIGISEITHDAFKDMVLTFSADPEWHHLNPSDTIVQKVRELQMVSWGMNTNFCKAYNLLLQVCQDHKLERADLPSLIVFSDMQFDQACDHRQSKKTMLQMIRRNVAKVASALHWEDNNPTPIVFWNLRNTGGHPVDKDTEGAVLLSGFSPSLLKLVMNGEAMKEEEVEIVQNDGTIVTVKVRATPEEILNKMLDDPLYDPVRRILGNSVEGALQQFEYMVESDEVEDEEEFEMI